MEDSNTPSDATPNTEEVFAKPTGIKYGLRQVKKTEQEEQFEKLKAYLPIVLKVELTN